MVLPLASYPPDPKSRLPATAVDETFPPPVPLLLDVVGGGALAPELEEELEEDLEEELEEELLAAPLQGFHTVTTQSLDVVPELVLLVVVVVVVFVVVEADELPLKVSTQFEVD